MAKTTSYVSGWHGLRKLMTTTREQLMGLRAGESENAGTLKNGIHNLLV
jgi:hypothetical protein